MILLTVSLLMPFLGLHSVYAAPTAGFTYTITGSTIVCTSTSTGATCYCWNITIDGTGSGSTGWICDASGRSFRFTVQKTCQVEITHGAKNTTACDSVTQGLGYITPIVDHPTYQNSTTRRLCEDNGFYWYKDKDGIYRCHEEPMVMPWNEPKTFPEASYPQFPEIQFGYFTLTFNGILLFTVVIFIALFIYSKLREKGGKNPNVREYIIREEK